jgi:excisionase family DNA binding protein
MTPSSELLVGPNDCLLTVRQVAQRLQVSSRTVWRLIRDERLGAVRIGRSVRVHPDAVTALISNLGG